MIINRNLKTLENKTGSKIKAELNNIIEIHQKYKNCFFWSPPMTAAGRRKIEFENELSFILKDKKYEVKQELNCSCKNMYFSTKIFVDGKKKDIRSLKKLI